MWDRETANKIIFFFLLYDEKATGAEMGVHTDHSFINDFYFYNFINVLYNRALD